MATSKTGTSHRSGSPFPKEGPLGGRRPSQSPPRSRRRARIAASIACLCVLGLAPAARAQDEVSENLEVFRAQILDFLGDLGDALDQARRQPALAPALDSVLGAESISQETLYAVRFAQSEDLAQLRDALAGVPGLLSVPGVLRAALEDLPAPAPMDPLAPEAYSCGNPALEFRKIQSSTVVLQRLKTSSSALSLALSVASTVDDAMDAATGECEVTPPLCVQVPTSGLQVVTVVIKGVFDAALLAVNFAADEIEADITHSELCLGGCWEEDESNGPGPSSSGDFFGKGCDNRDNDCDGAIDDADEDRFPPRLTIDPSLASRCFRTEAAARNAASLAAKAADDCSPVTLGVELTRTGCTGLVTATARDARNTSTAHASVTIDGDPPVIRTASLAPCYPTLAEAETAFRASGVTDCSPTDTRVRAVVKECAADLELEAVDACGNRSTEWATVRVDSAPPTVRIQPRILPAVGETHCFSSEQAAVAAVREATEFGDDCSSAAGLATAVTAGGGACNLQVTSSATDLCGLAGSDSVTVRVDTDPPEVSCSVATAVLWPADNALHDVGLAIGVSDGCDPAPRVDLIVTSDEPSVNANYTGDGPAPAPDAVIERGADGAPRVLLRAQRIGQPGNGDGRVYRIRVVATDACGLGRYADCFVRVPQWRSTTGSPPSAVNSGQVFDATRIN